MKNKGVFKFLKPFLSHLYNFLIFFGIIAFVLTCSFLLFFSGAEINESDIREMAPQVFINAVFIALLFTIVDVVRRRITVEKPAKEIQDAIDEMKKGNFSARVKLSGAVSEENRFYGIAEGVNSLGEELSGIETLRSDFVSNVSHEMKTPLAVISNYGKLLQAEGISEEQRAEYAKGITDATRRLSEMMTNILKLNRLENQQIFASLKKFDLGEQISECVLQFESVWERKGIDIDVDIEDGVIVEADAELLSHIWNNLLSNAFKFTDAGGRVMISLKSDGEDAVVKVEDTGCGMSPEVGAHIFEKFYQGDGSHATEGNGLGLALVKRVVDIVRGEISVESIEGEGSVFTVKIKKVFENGGN